MCLAPLFALANQRPWHKKTNGRPTTHGAAVGLTMWLNRNYFRRRRANNAQTPTPKRTNVEGSGVMWGATAWANTPPAGMGKPNPRKDPPLAVANAVGFTVGLADAAKADMKPRVQANTLIVGHVRSRVIVMLRNHFRNTRFN